MRRNRGVSVLPPGEADRHKNRVAGLRASSFALATLRSVGDVATFATGAAPYLRKDVGVIESETRALGLGTGVLGRVVRVVRDEPMALVDS